MTGDIQRILGVERKKNELKKEQEDLKQEIKKTEGVLASIPKELSPPKTPLDERIYLFHPRLRFKKCEIVTEFDQGLSDLVDKLFTVMDRHRGVGLAAPQIGVFKRVFAVHLVDDPGRPKVVMVNPAIISQSGEVTDWEGCLSLPGDRTRNRVNRPRELEVSFQDANGKTLGMMAHGMMARAISHETDHLDGMFFVDRISGLRREIIVNNFEKTCSRIKRGKILEEYVDVPEKF